MADHRCAVARPAWPDRIGIGHSVVAGILVHGIYLGGTAVAISLSIPAGLSALIPGLQPILTSTIANRWLGERVTPMQWGGLLLGLAGVVLILHDRPMSGQAGWGWIASAISLVSITLGTLYQRRYCSRDRLALRQSRAIHRGDRVLRHRRLPVRDERGALDHRIHSGARPGSRWCCRSARSAAVLADPALGRDIGGEPVLSGAGGDGADGVRAVRRAARCRRDCRHDRLCRCRAAGQPQRRQRV